MSLKLLFRTAFPALVTAASPLTLVKTGLSYAFGFDVSALRASLDPVYGTAGQRPATNTNDSATAGNVGEYIESVIATGSKVALVTATAKTITSISLTPGDWDVDVMGYILPASTTTTTVALLAISGVTNTLDLTAGKFSSLVTASGTFTGGNEIALPIAPYRLSLAVTTTVFLVAQSSFAVSTSAAYGLLRARRIR